MSAVAVFRKTAMRRSRAPSAIGGGGVGGGFNAPQRMANGQEDRQSSVEVVRQTKMAAHLAAVVQPAVTSLDSSFEPDQLLNEPTASSSSANLEPTRTTNPTAVDSRARFFEVVYAKCSTRKHKKWEDDGFLLCDGRAATLMGKTENIVARASHFKLAELTELSDGSRIVIGGKEVEVQNEMPLELYTSGRCFVGRGSTSAAAENKDEVGEPAAKRPLLKLQWKPFVQPLKEANDVILSERAVMMRQRDHLPLFNPDAPGALLMPDPPDWHQSENNKDNLPIVKVVVDPQLSQHLRPHQREGVEFLYRCVTGMNDSNMMGAILADDMGLGKSLQAITLIWTLLKQGAYGQRPLIRRVLLVCPCTLVQNWQNEFRKWLGDHRLKVLTLTKTQEQKKFEQTAAMNQVLIMSYEMALRCEQLKRMEFGLLVCDEGHRLKNAAVKINTTLTSLEIPRRVLLTGTPVQNDLLELYSLVDFVNPGHLGHLKTFKRDYETAIAQGRDGNADDDQVELGKDRVLELQAMISLCVLRRTAEVNSEYLPSKTDFVLFCRPSPLQVAVYRRVLMGVAYSSITLQHFAVIDALRKVCNHPALILKKVNGNDDSSECVTLNRNVEDAFPEDYGSDGMKVDDSGKLTILCELLTAIHSMSQKVVIASNFTQTLDLIEQLCASADYKYLRLDGSTPTTKRDEYVQQFNSQNGVTSVFLLSTKAGGVGLNLIGASRLILYDCDWNPANDRQAMARVWRDGQRNPVQIYRLLTTGTIEEKIFQRQVKKTGLSGSVLDSVGSSEDAGKLSFTSEELRDLFTLDTNTDCNTHDLIGCECDGDGSLPPQRNDDDVTCQSTKRNTAVKSASMAQLFAWQHYRSSNVGNAQLPQLDSLLSEASPVSFVFQLFADVKKEETLPVDNEETVPVDNEDNGGDQ